MVNPVLGYLMTTPYRKTGSMWKACGWHTGADWAAPAGTPVVAAIPGNLRVRNYGAAFGIQCAISPDPGDPVLPDGEVFYAHLSWLDQSLVGQRVEAGQVIGKVGSTGNSTGPHLHFEASSVKGVWDCSTRLDPMEAARWTPDDGWKYPAGTEIRLSYLTWKGHEKNHDGTSVSIGAWQDALNHHSLDGGATLPVTEKWHDMTAAETQKCQEQHFPPADTPLEAVFVGPRQAHHVVGDTGAPYVVVDDREPDVPAGVMHGVDVSSHQSGITLADVPADFVVVKATEGSSYVSPSMLVQANETLATNRLLGLYHFARPDTDSTAVQEADWFADNVADWIGKAILVLDWEREPLDNIGWVEAWVNRVKERTGVTPMIYMSESVTRLADWGRLGCPLWVAKYSSNEPNTGRWPWVLWQWTSSWHTPAWDGDLDHNTSRWGKAEWEALATPDTNPSGDDTDVKEVLRAQVFGDVIDVDSNHRRVFDALPDKDDNEVKIIVLGDLVHKNSPLRLWTKEWLPTYGSLPTCKVWSVLGNHGWGWDARGRLDAAHGRNYWRFRRAFHEECTRDVPHPKYCWMKTRPGWLLLGLDSEHPRKSRRFLNRMVRQYGKGRKVVVFIHRAPILPPGSKAPKFKGQRLKRDIHRHADLVMSGHSHRFWRKRVGGTQYIVAGTGEDKGWANLRLFSDGEYRVNFTRL